MKKTVLLSLLAVCLFSQNMCSANVAPLTAPEQNVKQEIKKMPPRMRRPQLTNEDAAAKLQQQYGADKQEALQLLQNGHNFDELNYAYLYAALAKVDVSKVLVLHEKAPWGRVRVQLGLNADEFAKRNTQYQLAKLDFDGIVSKEMVQEYLQQGYPLNDIFKAMQIAKKINKNMEEVLTLHTAVKDWEQVEQELGLEQQPKTGWRRNRGQRFGAGFAGLHVRNMTKERALIILHKDYLFSEEELAPLYDELGFSALEDVCLHAYFGKVSLAKIMEMRGQYSWERIKHLLGLTPQVYFERCVEYQARRLKERMDIPVTFTKEYMKQGFPMHYVNSAYLLALQSKRNPKEVILMKTPKNKWDDVALAIGLTKDECQDVKNKISQEFGRHE